MPREQLTGTLDEQCDFLYELALDKMKDGNYTGAFHALKEVVAHRPDDSAAVEALSLAKFKKAEQRNLLTWSISGGIVFLGIGTWLGIGNDLLFIGLTVIGVLVGYALANLFNSYRKRPAY